MDTTALNSSTTTALKPSATSPSQPPALTDIPTEILTDICAYLDDPSPALSSCVILRSAAHAAILPVLRAAINGPNPPKATPSLRRWFGCHFATESDPFTLCLLTRDCVGVKILRTHDSNTIRARDYDSHPAEWGSATTTITAIVQHVSGIDFDRVVHQIVIPRLLEVKRTLPADGNVDMSDPCAGDPAGAIGDALAEVCYSLLDMLSERIVRRGGFTGAIGGGFAELCGGDIFAVHVLTGEKCGYPQSMAAARMGAVYMHSEISDRFVVPVYYALMQNHVPLPREFTVRAAALRQKTLAHIAAARSFAEAMEDDTVAYLYLTPCLTSNITTRTEEKIARKGAGEVGDASRESGLIEVLEVASRLKGEFVAAALMRFGWKSIFVLAGGHAQSYNVRPAGVHWIDSWGSIGYTTEYLWSPRANLRPRFRVKSFLP